MVLSFPKNVAQWIFACKKLVPIQPKTGQLLKLPAKCLQHVGKSWSYYPFAIPLTLTEFACTKKHTRSLRTSSTRRCREKSSNNSSSRSAKLWGGKKYAKSGLIAHCCKSLTLIEHGTHRRLDAEGRIPGIPNFRAQWIPSELQDFHWLAGCYLRVNTNIFTRTSRRVTRTTQ